MSVGEVRGNTVYCIDPGKKNTFLSVKTSSYIHTVVLYPHFLVHRTILATKTFYFTYSRVGGSRGPIQSATSCANHQEEPTLAFESRFESGNLQKAVQV